MSVVEHQSRSITNQKAMVPAPAIAFFDLDYTLLNTSSSSLYVRYLHRNGLISYPQMARVGWWMALYKLSLLNFPQLITQVMRMVNSDDETTTRQALAAWVVEDVVAHINEPARRRIAEHQAAGHYVAILSATTPYVVQPLAQSLGLSLDQALCTRLQVVDGKFTGEFIAPACYGVGKIHWARRFAEQHDVALGRCYFYSDSYSDRPLMDLVGYPVPVNPDARLTRYARLKGWPVEKFY